MFLPCWESEIVKSKCLTWGSADAARKMFEKHKRHMMHPAVPLSETSPMLFFLVSADLYKLENSHKYKDFASVAVIMEERPNLV